MWTQPCGHNHVDTTMWTQPCGNSSIVRAVCRNVSKGGKFWVRTKEGGGGGGRSLCEVLHPTLAGGGMTQGGANAPLLQYSRPDRLLDSYSETLSSTITQCLQLLHRLQHSTILNQATPITIQRAELSRMDSTLEKKLTSEQRTSCIHFP